MSRWMLVCQDCWQAQNPNEYLPEAGQPGTECAVCGFDGYCVNVNPKDWIDESAVGSPWVQNAQAKVLPASDKTARFTK